MNKHCIVNVSTGDFYCKMQERLHKSFAGSIDSVIIFACDINGIQFPVKLKYRETTGIELLLWRNILPLGSRPHSESPYGFKVHAIKAAYEMGYTSILWLDSPAYAVKEDISPIFEKIEKEGYYAMSHIDPLCNYVGNEASYEWGVTLKQLDNEGLNLPSGSCYGFNLNSSIGLQVYSSVLTAEKAGFFKSSDKRHRHDEAILALILRAYNKSIFTFDPLFQSDSPECVIKSGGDHDLY